MIMVTLATIAFALLIDPAGIVVAMVVSMTLAALGTPETRWREFVVFSLIMLAMGLGMFIYGLGMPIKVLPWS
jgi:putative tricarboxylic transport membrane protein